MFPLRKWALVGLALHRSRGFRQNLQAGFLAEVVIEQHDIDRLLADDSRAPGTDEQLAE